MTPAQKEAHAYAQSAHQIDLMTLEFNDPSFTQPARVVCDNEPLSVEIEDGTQATFAPFFFKFEEPPLKEDPDAVARIVIDNLTGELTPFLMAGSKSGNAVKIIFRVYQVDEIADTVTLIRSIPLEMRSGNDNLTSITVTAARRNPANIAFPNERYTADRFPGLS